MTQPRRLNTRGWQMTKQSTCLNCGKKFTPWRAKRFCSERCQDSARRRAKRSGNPVNEGMHAGGLYDSALGCPKHEQNQQLDERQSSRLSGDERYVWAACNEVTRRLTREGSQTAIGWAMLVEGKGWYGGVRDKRGDWSFGPATLARALKAVEAWIRHEPFETRIDDGERMWRGDAMAFVMGIPHVPAPPVPGVPNSSSSQSPPKQVCAVLR
jgi:hypothetical protein